MNIVFHIGYHKTATSWLQQRYFVQHPNIHSLVNSRAPWDDEIMGCLVRTDDRKFNPDVFRDKVLERIGTINERRDDDVFMLSAERLSGHPISGGYDSFRIAERIRQGFPDARIICVIREQLAMLESVYKELVIEGYCGTFSNLWGTQRWKSVGFDPSFYEYDLLAKQYIDLFGKDGFLILRYEDMRSSCSDFLASICTFMGVPDFVPADTRSDVNRSMPNCAVSIIRRLNHFSKNELHPFPLFVLPGGFKKIAVALSRRLPCKTTLISEMDRNEISDYYKPSNRRLASLLGMDKVYPY